MLSLILNVRLVKVLRKTASLLSQLPFGFGLYDRQKRFNAD